MNERLVRHVLYPLHERLKRKPTFRRLEELEQTQWLSPERLAEYQFARLQQLLDFAYAHVPYYRSVLDEHGLPAGRVQSPDDLRRLPFLTRELIRSRFDDLRARTPLPHVHQRSSGGSTGAPVTVLVDMGRMGFGEAARMRAQRWFGVDVGAREIVLWGSPIEITRQDRIRQVRDWCLNSRLLSAFDMGEEALARHAAVIRRCRPTKMYGYASALSLLAGYFERESLPPPRGLRAVFATAEPLFDFQRKTIEAALGCPVGVEYGCRDGGLVALECRDGGLHIAAEGMYVEILDPDAEGRGEIVLTNLESKAFPIIRYRTGDMGSFDPSPCHCGRSLPKLRAVEGRRTDFLVTPGGRVLHALSAIYILREMPAIREFRIVQEAINRLVLHLVLRQPIGPAEEASLRVQFAAVFGSDMRLKIVRTTSLPRTASGKFRYVESQVAQAVLERLMAPTQTKERPLDDR
jgi:phenylacetate-coenzyme A ligase PaaK-like adenylate-forming protein